MVTDVGSVKRRVIELVEPHLDMRRFVPGHPVAGTENSGPDAAVDRLFEGRWSILTPDARTDPAAVARVAALWRAVGADVERMDAAHHDQVLAVTSHLPHLLAFNIVNTARSLETVLEREVLKYAAGGFTDFTRIAASDPTLWRDVFLHNRGAVLEVLGRYIEDLMALQRVIRWGEGEALQERFASAQAIRRGVVQAGQAFERRPLDGALAPASVPAPPPARKAAPQHADAAPENRVARTEAEPWTSNRPSGRSRRTTPRAATGCFGPRWWPTSTRPSRSCSSSPRGGATASSRSP